MREIFLLNLPQICSRMKDELKELELDHDGMLTYEYIVNHVDEIEDTLSRLCEMMKLSDKTGQFLASTARFLHAVDKDRFDKYVGGFIEGALDRDREHKYIGSLLEAIWGVDYKDRIEELNQTDDNFRRIYKRIYMPGVL